MDKLTLIEPPYVSVQGEGLNIGRPTLFIRTAGCPVQCEWCDSRYSWGTGEYQLTAEQLEQLIISKKTKAVWFTGGEPLVWQKWLSGFVLNFSLKHLLEHELQICTSGCIWNKDTEELLEDISWVTVDYKINSKLKTSLSLVQWIVENKRFNSELKIVIDRNEDWEVAIELCKTFPKLPVIVQPKYVVLVKRNNDLVKISYSDLQSTDNVVTQVPEVDYRGFAHIVSQIAHMVPNMRFLPQWHKVIWPEQVKGI